MQERRKIMFLVNYLRLASFLICFANSHHLPNHVGGEHDLHEIDIDVNSTKRGRSIEEEFPEIACKPIAECEKPDEIFGTNENHFLKYKNINFAEIFDCRSTLGHTICVLALNIETTITPKIETTTPIPIRTIETIATQNVITTTTPRIVRPTHPTIADPATFLPYYNNVQIIGPKPIYITLTNIHGPKINNEYGRGSRLASSHSHDGSVESELAHSDGNHETENEVLSQAAALIKSFRT